MAEIRASRRLTSGSTVTAFPPLRGYKSARVPGVKCQKESRCIPDFGLITTTYGGQKNRGNSGLMVVIFGVRITQASGGLMMAGSGGLPTVGNFGLMMVTYMAHQKRCPG